MARYLNAELLDERTNEIVEYFTFEAEDYDTHEDHVEAAQRIIDWGYNSGILGRLEWNHTAEFTGTCDYPRHGPWEN